MIDSSLTRDPRLTEPGSSEVGRMFRAPGWTWTSFGEIGWWIRPEWREILLGPLGFKLDQWAREGRVRIIKSNPQRVVYRVELPEAALYIKHFKVPSWRETLRQWFRRGKGRNEGKRAIRLASIGVPTIMPIALGEQRKRKFLFENYLVTLEIPHTQPLDVFLEQDLPSLPASERSSLRRALAASLATLTARLHDSGFLHQDFHPGNVLVERQADGGVSLSMIDLDALRWRKHLSWNDAQANLALLNHYFWLRCNRADRHRFLLAYLEERRLPHPDARGFARRIEQATRAWAERLWTRWGKRGTRNNKYFQIHQQDRSWAVVSTSLDPQTVNRLLADLDAPFLDPHASVVKDSRTASLVELSLPVNGRPTKVIYKRFNRKKWLDPIWALFRPTRGWRAWQSGQHLESRGLPTPRNLAFLQRQRIAGPGIPCWFLPLQTYLVTVRAEPAMTLLDYASLCLPALSPSARRAALRALAVSLARLVRRMHERSLGHRDLKAANILVEGDPFASELTLSLIDLVGVELRHPLARHRRVQNLARLHVSLSRLDGYSRTLALRFLRDYLPWASTRRDDWKALWRDIERRSQQKELRNQKTGRILS